MSPLAQKATPEDNVPVMKTEITAVAVVESAPGDSEIPEDNVANAVTDGDTKNEDDKKAIGDSAAQIYTLPTDGSQSAATILAPERVEESIQKEKVGVIEAGQIQVQHLSPNVASFHLYDIFNNWGQVTDVKFGAPSTAIIHYGSYDEAADAVDAMDNATVDSICVRTRFVHDEHQKTFLYGQEVQEGAE